MSPITQDTSLLEPKPQGILKQAALARSFEPSAVTVSAAMENKAEAAAFPAQSPLSSIDWGTRFDHATISVYFAGEGETFDGATSVGWNDYEKGQTMLAFQQYENIINVDVVTTNDASIADFKLVTINRAPFLGYCNPVGTHNAGVGVFVRHGVGWDEKGQGGLEQGGYGFITLIHEFGHGFGLAHPHDKGGGSTVMNGVDRPFNDYGEHHLNQGVFTTMSYNDGWATGPNGPSHFIDRGWQGTMMALDIAALQEKYGANTSYHTGDDTYRLSGKFAQGAMYSCIWDAGGVDQIKFTGGGDAVIDLRAATLDYSKMGGGVVSYVDGVIGGYTIANGVVIENARGGSGDDQIHGNEAANKLHGGEGDDVLTGGAGKDRLFGGEGNDTFQFGSLNIHDRIMDLQAGDVIDLSGLDAKPDKEGDQAFHLVDAFGGFAGQVTVAYNAERGMTEVLMDVDGDARANGRILILGEYPDFNNFLL
ncbi:MAG: M10 family metallopeptidase [Caulobacteraceae bacterium]